MPNFFTDILWIDSTSGKENVLADFICENYMPDGAALKIYRTSEGRKNLLFHWGDPTITFCSHLDTVPPYIPPKIENDVIYGRGSCDAKGQIACMYDVCSDLYSKGKKDFALLLLAGEEDGSKGAKAVNDKIKDCEFIIIGEPTENKLIEATKGTLLFNVNAKGRSCHSGYPEIGESAADKLIIFLQRIREFSFPNGDSLGKTTFNISGLQSGNAMNVLPEEASCRLYFRTTRTSHDAIEDLLRSLSGNLVEIEKCHGDRPFEFFTIDGIEKGTASFGTDAPSLSNFGKKILYGPGSILTAHNEDEHIKKDDMKKAVKDLHLIYEKISKEIN
jgi:acetylornithine deacetylase